MTGVIVDTRTIEERIAARGITMSGASPRRKWMRAPDGACLGRWTLIGMDRLMSDGVLDDLGYPDPPVDRPMDRMMTEAIVLGLAPCGPACFTKALPERKAFVRVWKALHLDGLGNYAMGWRGAVIRPFTGDPRTKGAQCIGDTMEDALAAAEVLA